VLTYTDDLGNPLPGNILTIPASNTAELYGEITNTDLIDPITIDSTAQVGPYTTPLGGISTLVSYGADHFFDNDVPYTVPADTTSPVLDLLTIDTGPTLGTAYGYYTANDTVDSLGDSPLFQINISNAVPEPGAVSLIGSAVLTGSAILGRRIRRSRSRK
jgi:hypothetical protein